jgi:hypothetical protein
MSLAWHSHSPLPAARFPTASAGFFVQAPPQESATPATRQTSGGPVIPRKGNDTMIVPNPSTPEASR